MDSLFSSDKYDLDESLLKQKKKPSRDFKLKSANDLEKNRWYFLKIQLVTKSVLKVFAITYQSKMENIPCTATIVRWRSGDVSETKKNQNF